MNFYPIQEEVVLQVLIIFYLLKTNKNLKSNLRNNEFHSATMNRSNFVSNVFYRKLCGQAGVRVSAWMSQWQMCSWNTGSWHVGFHDFSCFYPSTFRYHFCNQEVGRPMFGINSFTSSRSHAMQGCNEFCGNVGLSSNLLADMFRKFCNPASNLI